MAAEKTYRVGKLSDKSILSLFDKIEEKFGTESNGTVHISNMSIPYKDKETLKKLRKNSFTIDRVNFITAQNKFTVQFRRGIALISDQPNNREPSPYFDEIFFNINVTAQNNRAVPDLEEVIALTSILESNTTIKPVTDGTNSKASNSIDLLQSQIEALASQHRQMISDVDKQRQKHDKDYEEKLEELNKANKKKEDKIESNKKLAESSLVKKQQKLDERSKELDDRDYMFARRDMSKDMIKKITERLRSSMISSSAMQSKMLILILLLGASIFLGYWSFLSFIEINALPVSSSGAIAGKVNIDYLNIEADLQSAISTTHAWVMIIKMFLTSLGSVAFLIYAINWLQKLYYDDVNSRRELERYAYDVNRASWIIETVMEMKSKQDNSDVPNVWIESVCNNLFNDINHQDSTDNENTLATLLNSSANAQIGSDGFKFDIKGRGTKKLARSI